MSLWLKILLEIAFFNFFETETSSVYRPTCCFPHNNDNLCLAYLYTFGLPPLQYQNLLWLTCPTAMFTIRPQSPGDCLMITFPQITTWLNIAGKHELIISVIRKKNNLNRHDGELHHFCYNRTCSSLQILFQLPWLFWHKYIINISYQSSVKVWSCLIYKRQNNMFTAVTISGL